MSVSPFLKDKLITSTPWLPSQDLLQRLSAQPSTPGQPFKKCTILSSDPECDFILHYFFTHKPPGYGIKGIAYISNPFHKQAFEAELINMELEAKKFLPRWKDSKEPRDHVIQRWKELASQFSPLKITNPEGNPETLSSAKVLPLWHGSTLEKCNSICTSGFTYFGKHHYFNPDNASKSVASTDIGYFGSGIYFTNSARYAAMYNSGELLLAWVSMREPYPVVSDVPHPKKCTDIQILKGKGAYQNYNAHYIPVASAYPENSNCMIYYPCYQDQKSAWDEIVVFQKAQTLTRFWVSLAADSPSLPFQQMYSFDQCYLACQQGNMTLIKAWIQEDPKRLYAKGNQGETFYQAAMAAHQLEVLKFFHEQDPGLLKVYQDDGSTLLHLAAGLGYEDIAQWIYAQDPTQLTQKNQEGWTPLHLAAFQEKISILKLFWETIKADPTFILQIVTRSCPESLKFLLEQGISVQTANTFKQTLLHLAAQAGQEDNVSCLIEHKADIDAQDHSKRTPLFLAVLQGHRSVVKKLIERHARLDIISIEQENILHAAAFYGNTPLLSELLPLCKELIHAKDHDGKTPLHKAVWGPEKPDAIELLLSWGASVNGKNLYDYTALHWAAKHGHLKSAQLLLKHGADSAAVNANGDTPLDLAIRWGQDQVARLLIDPNIHLSSQAATSINLDNNNDLEGEYYTQFTKAYENGEVLEQILYLEKLSDIYLVKKDYFKAAYLLNNTLAAAKLYSFDTSYQQLLIKKLEKIEGYFLEEQGIKVSADHKGYIEKYRHCLKVARDSVELSLKTEKSIEKVQAELTSQLQSLLGELVKSCISLLGETPTPFAILGLGSMSRQEMCPYSDIEFAILIQKDTPQNKAYFRKLVHLIKLKIINCGESVFPILGPKRVENELMDEKGFTPHGFSMDSSLSPLGKEGIYELIGTPEQLAYLLQPAWLQKNEAEVILVNSLISSSFVFGQKSLVEDYNKRVQEVLNTKEKLFGPKLREERALKLLQGHLEEFRPLLDEHRVSLRGFDVKKDLYRPLQMILGALALYYDLNTYNTLNCIQKLYEKSVFNKEGAQNLQKALQQALIWRMQAHLFYRTEKEIMYYAQDSKNSKEQELLTFDAEQSKKLVEVYRVIIPLNKAANAFVKGDKKSFFNTKLYAETIGTTIHLDEEDNLQYENALQSYTQAVALRPDDLDALDNLQRIKFRLDQIQDALKYNFQRLSILKKQYGSEKGENHPDIAMAYDFIGIDLSYLGRHQEALEYQYKALKIREKLLDRDSLDIARSYHNIGKELGCLRKYQDALEYSIKALKIRENILGEKSEEIAESLNSIAVELGYLERYQEALEYLNRALDIRIAALGKNHPEVATIYENRGRILAILSRYQEASNNIKAAVEINSKIFGEKHFRVTRLNKQITSITSMLGKQKSLENEKQDLEFAIQKYGEKSSNVALHYNNIGMSLKNLSRYEDALVFMKKSLEIWKEVEGEKKSGIALCYNNIAMTLRDMKKYDNALFYITQALEVWKEVNGERHSNVARAYNNKGLILRDLKKYEDALQNIEQALVLREEILGKNNLDVATTYYNKSLILSDLGMEEEAKKCMDQCSKIRKEVLGEEYSKSKMKTDGFISLV